MTKLSVNLNKVALLRNSRNSGIPGVLRAAEICIAAGADGITVHPRPDQRHIRPHDVTDLAALLARHPQVEYNIEGNPFPEFMDLVRRVRPHQCTLVPDSPEQSTSDHGWNIKESEQRLREVIAELHLLGCRVSLFIDHDSAEIPAARAIGADRIELYTEPYARAFERGEGRTMLREFARAAEEARACGLGVNAGHDLNLANLPDFSTIPGIDEVSIGHALIADALEMGLAGAVAAYRDILRRNRV